MILSGGGVPRRVRSGRPVVRVRRSQRASRGAPPSVDILCGTSVGAINACYLAAHLADPVLGMRRLVDLWSNLELARVLGFGLRQVVGIPRLLLGGSANGQGLFDVTPMSDLVQREISWKAVSRCLRRRQLRALSVSCTEVATGRTVVFMQTSPDRVIPSSAPPRTLFRADRIGPQHALASAAIPLLFPPVRIDSELYLDGGLRQNTPIAPALRLGATHVLAIGCSREVKGRVVHEGGPSIVSRAPGAAFLLGKVLNAFLLDHIDTDLQLLARVNDFVADGQRVFGEEFQMRMDTEAERHGRLPYERIEALAVRPSEDIGGLAREHLERGKLRGDPMVTKRFFSILGIGADREADLASYLLFDGPFCRKLIEMGRADAHARRDDLMRFFGAVDDDGKKTDDEPTERFTLSDAT